MPSHFHRVLFVSVLSACLAACSSEKGPSSGTAAAEGRGAGGGGGRGGRGGGAVPVVTAKAQAKSVALTLPAVGAGEALSTVQIRAQVTGQLSQIHFAEGQEVRKGQLLFEIDARPFETALAQAQAVLARDTATANNAQSGSRPPAAAPAAPGGVPPTDSPVPGMPIPVEVGKVTFIDNAVDPTTGTIKLKATFPNTSRTLWPGLFVQVALQLTTDPHAI